MSTVPTEARPSSDVQASTLKRRHWVFGAGAAGAAALAVKALPGVAPAAPAAVAAAKEASDSAGGYRLTAHIQRYYDTAKS
jgi:hypothetical protein